MVSLVRFGGFTHPKVALKLIAMLRLTTKSSIGSLAILTEPLAFSAACLSIRL
jgi:hypothetical protein